LTDTKRQESDETQAMQLSLSSWLSKFNPFECFQSLRVPDLCPVFPWYSQAFHESSVSLALVAAAWYIRRSKALNSRSLANLQPGKIRVVRIRNWCLLTWETLR